MLVDFVFKEPSKSQRRTVKALRLVVVEEVRALVCAGAKAAAELARTRMEAAINFIVFGFLLVVTLFLVCELGWRKNCENNWVGSMCREQKLSTLQMRQCERIEVYLS